MAEFEFPYFFNELLIDFDQIQYFFKLLTTDFTI